jgi:hypothetical protein
MVITKVPVFKFLDFFFKHCLMNRLHILSGSAIITTSSDLEV